MKDAGGAIVQTGSMWAIQAIGATLSAAYSAANAGVHAMVRNLAIELAPYKIRIMSEAAAGAPEFATRHGGPEPSISRSLCLAWPA